MRESLKSTSDRSCHYGNPGCTSDLRLHVICGAMDQARRVTLPDIAAMRNAMQPAPTYGPCGSVCNWTAEVGEDGLVRVICDQHGCLMFMSVDSYRRLINDILPEGIAPPGEDFHAVLPDQRGAGAAD